MFSFDTYSIECNGVAFPDIYVRYTLPLKKLFNDYRVCSEAWKNYIIQLDTLREEFKKHKELIHGQLH